MGPGVGAAGSGRGSQGLGVASVAAPSESCPKRCRRDVHSKDSRVFRSEALLAPEVAEEDESRLEEDALSSLTICLSDLAAPKLDDSSARSSFSPAPAPAPSVSPKPPPPHRAEEGRGGSPVVEESCVENGAVG